ncbi:hypothetical protein [Pedobacter xixiisoli]|uniref:Uncharacterized protein n=1 Tax=Pedobacter xixiisoli TaxID=1476464 RepID=A0A286A0I0_9SPHI|nr:hypothetical protein [Pedobacter xixiisoli]SOD15406.1 hypothetical protein SAMN06297358_2400 [Pedobacter xixiisoli]
MKRIAITIISLLALTSCGKNSSPDGRAQLRDAELSQRIDKLEKKQIVILDSMRLLNEKIEAIKN